MTKQAPITQALQLLIDKGQHDKTTRQLAIIMQCRETAQTVRGLAGFLICTKPAITRNVDKLVSEGLMKRKPDPADARSVLVELTAHGKRFAELFC